MINKTFRISDDSGFLGLVNVDKYDSFVNEDWDFNDLRERFIQEMNRSSLLFWATGQEGLWNVRITTDEEEHIPFRAMRGEIIVTDGKLFLTNFEDLSMVAQFRDEKLPINADLELRIENGNYIVKINQLFDPDSLPPYDNDKVHFEIVIEKTFYGEGGINKFDGIPWLQ